MFCALSRASSNPKFSNSKSQTLDLSTDRLSIVRCFSHVRCRPTSCCAIASALSAFDLLFCPLSVLQKEFQLKVSESNTMSSVPGLESLVDLLQKEFQLKVSESNTMSSGPGLESLVDQTISVITNDGRNIVGILKGFDQATNIILDESHERVYSTKEGVQQLVLGLSIVGELDEELDSHLDLSNLRAHPLKPVIH
ncbi:hypothetical protein EZV62_002923 [Acer yangbiense]|uniref:U6 snRNA-associated Sm-like protein LSm8 n=2 Tax=Acer yangbiense TaxID=1000413 RepID=A0A5C7IZI7_9ROSI|nr:hypothetical protein EZV62_002920 [Acer yangbiense]TXG74344.1 hypothetical protein EZV62_002923 [Acer yangbiense]